MGPVMSMRTTLRLPDDLHRELRRRAFDEGRTFGDVVAECLERGLRPDFGVSRPAEAEAREEAIVYRADPLPVLRVAPDGTLSVPAPLASMAGLEAGSDVLARITERGLAIEPAYPLTRKLIGSLKGIWSDEDPVTFIRRLRNEDDDDRA